MSETKYSRPSLSDPVGWSGQFEREQLARLREIAEAEGKPVSQVVRLCVAFLLDNQRLLDMALSNGK